MPSIIREEQCMDVNTNSRRGWIWVHFSTLAIHLSSSQPEKRLLPPRSLIKQERINNRCLRMGSLCLLEKKVPWEERPSNKPQSAIRAKEQQVPWALPSSFQVLVSLETARNFYTKEVAINKYDSLCSRYHRSVIEDCHKEKTLSVRCLSQ